MPGCDSSALAATTFWWFPPEREVTGAWIVGTRTFSDVSSDLTAVNSVARRVKEPRVNRRRALTAAFSRTDRDIISPSRCRSAGMYAAFSLSSLAVSDVPSTSTVPWNETSPASAARNSVCPLPMTPAIPTISPRRR